MSQHISRPIHQQVLEEELILRSKVETEDVSISVCHFVQQVLHEVIKKGTQEFCICPGARNAPLVYALVNSPHLKLHYWPEERSAAFFALGRMKATGRPVAVVTTSGTAAGELLPAAMEAYYTGLPLLLITADRPVRFRGSGAPQAAEHVGLYGCYTPFTQDLAVEGNQCDLSEWNCQGPAHLNVCLEEPKDSEIQDIHLKEKIGPFISYNRELSQEDQENFYHFISHTKFPFIVVGALSPIHREFAIQFLLNLNAPLYAEAVSGLREDPRLAHLRITNIDGFWEQSLQHHYLIDGILRLGGVPTARLWRDLEYKKGKIAVCSISEHPFSGLSWSRSICCSLNGFFKQMLEISSRDQSLFADWLDADQKFNERLISLFLEEPSAEPSLIYQLSKRMGEGSRIYLGNSLPIREWDLAATFENRHYYLAASRGLAGIDGQISTFLGFTLAQRENWGIIGDLTALYDMVGPWILSQLQDTYINLVVINNSGGLIFKRMFSHSVFQHPHHLNFSSLANFWGLNYDQWLTIPDVVQTGHCNQLIELIPDCKATERFWKRIKEL